MLWAVVNHHLPTDPQLADDWSPIDLQEIHFEIWRFWLYHGCKVAAVLGGKPITNRLLCMYGQGLSPCHTATCSYEWVNNTLVSLTRATLSTEISLVALTSIQHQIINTLELRVSHPTNAQDKVSPKGIGVRHPHPIWGESPPPPSIEVRPTPPPHPTSSPHTQQNKENGLLYLIIDSITFKTTNSGTGIISFYMIIHCLSIMWNHPTSSAVLPQIYWKSISI